jgi:hypothetical protein
LGLDIFGHYKNPFTGRNVGKPALRWGDTGKIPGRPWKTPRLGFLLGDEEERELRVRKEGPAR